MKKILFAAGILLSGLSMAQNQIIQIQDPKFKQALIDAGVDTNNDGQISVSEAAAVTKLDITNKNIDVIKPEEIEYFKNLKTLDVYGNNITSLSLSKNKKLLSIDALPSSKLVWIHADHLPNLKILYVGGPEFKYLHAYSSPQINYLSLAGSTNFEGLLGEENALDLSVYPNLTIVNLEKTKVRRVKIDNPELVSFYAEDAYLEYLDVSKAPKLKKLDVRKNILKVLNVANGNNTNFTEFKAEELNSGLTCIQVDNSFYPPNTWTKNPGAAYNSDCGCDHPLFISDKNFYASLLKDFDTNTTDKGVICPNEATKITEYSYTTNDADKKIHSFNGIEGLENLKKITLEKGSEAYGINFSGNTKLEEIKIVGDPRMEWMSTRNLSKLKTIHIRENPKFYGSNYNFLPRNNHPELYYVFINNGGGALKETFDFETFPKLEFLDLINLKIDGQSGFTTNNFKINKAKSLKYLRLMNVGLTEANTSELKNLETLYLLNNKLTKLDVSQNTKLQSLSLTDNEITSLDLSQNKDLGLNNGYVSLKNNKLKSLNLANGKNYQLTDVYLTGNPELKCVKIDASFIPPATWKKDNQTAFSNNCGMGVAEVADQAFRMYPNPVQDVLHIDSDKTVESVTVYDANGRLVFTKEGVNQVNVSALHAGVYIVQVVIDGQKVSKKIIKK